MPLFNITTQKDNILPVFKGAKPLLDHQLKIVRDDFNKALNEVNERTLPFSTYNCHGMALVSRLGVFGTDQREPIPIQTTASEEFELEPGKGEQDIYTLLADNGYIKKRAINLQIEKFRLEDKILRGDIAIYKYSGKITHSALVFAVEKDLRSGTSSLELLSKLNMAGEYFHNADNSYIMSIYGNILEIWSNSIV